MIVFIGRLSIFRKTGFDCLILEEADGEEEDKGPKG
jgi:hypothetical protein